MRPMCLPSSFGVACNGTVFRSGPKPRRAPQVRRCRLCLSHRPVRSHGDPGAICPSNGAFNPSCNDRRNEHDRHLDSATLLLPHKSNCQMMFFCFCSGVFGTFFPTLLCSDCQLPLFDQMKLQPAFPTSSLVHLNCRSNILLFFVFL